MAVATLSMLVGSSLSACLRACLFVEYEATLTAAYEGLFQAPSDAGVL